MKNTIILFYVVVVAVMATATILEKYQGTQYVADNIYGAWWFSLLWALLAAAGVCWFVKRRVRRFGTVVLHLSFVVILLGALLTHLTARHGVVHIREGETTNNYLTQDMHVHTLPFSVRLDRFEITYHEGTMAPADFASHITFIPHDDATSSTATVAMNRIATFQGYRLYQSSYDSDGHGTVLAMNSDPWGIPVTYTGYALLFFALVWMLIDPSGTFRQLLRSPLLKKGAVATLLSLAAVSPIRSAEATTPPTLPAATAAAFGRLNMSYNERICPVETYALDFTKKLCGKRSYQGLTPEQVLTGFIFWPDEWRQQPVIRVKGGAMKDRLQLPDHCSVNTFFNPAMGGYILGPYIEEYYQGRQDAFHKDVAKMDDRLMLIMELGQQTPLRLFPYTTAAKSSSPSATSWNAPAGKLPPHIDNDTQQFIRNIFTLMAEEARAGHYDRVDDIIGKIGKYQQKQGGTSIPSATRLKAEHLYNKVPFATILFMLNLTMGLLTLAVFIWQMRRPKFFTFHFSLFTFHFSLFTYCLSFLALTVCLALRWIITGHVPMANGYETMLTLAWLIMVLAALAYRSFTIALTFGFLLSGFFLLVSHINQMDPQIGHLMPVLNSPLLSLHVSIIMMAFALLSMTFICGVTALCLPSMRQQLQLLSRLMLYPALTTLGLGIFIGAIWANVSWGTYWSWDPKETWALITFMVYAVVVHTQSLPVFRRPLAYHVYMTLAFLTILMTYFGVNYFLGGMHSYA